MFFPFETLTHSEPLRLSDDIAVARYGSLTINEAIAFSSIVGDNAAAFKDVQDPTIDAVAAVHLRQILTTLLLISRHDPSWSLARTRNRLVAADWLAASEFLLNERDRWGNLPEAEDAPSAPPLDWGVLFWRLQRAYPTEQRFTANRFGNCPIALIEQALSVANQLELERLEHEARAVSNVGVLLAMAHGAKSPQSRMFNEFEAIAFVKAAREVVAPPVARSFLELYEKGRVPEWAAELVNLEVVRAAAV